MECRAGVLKFMNSGFGLYFPLWPGTLTRKALARNGIEVYPGSLERVLVDYLPGEVLGAGHQEQVCRLTSRIH
jgi:hypothetical protein